LSRTVKKIICFKIVFIMLIIITGCQLLPKEEEALTPPLVKPVQEKYSTAKAVRGTIQKEVSGNGRFESTSQDEAIYKDKDGRIGKFRVKSGDMVKAGDVLVELLLNGLDIKLKEQELALEIAKYELINANIDQDNVERLRKAKIQLELENLRYNHLKNQYNSRIIRSDIDGQVIFVETMKEGDSIEPYHTLVTVADPKKLRVMLELTSNGNSVVVGTNALVTFNNAEYKGKVVQAPSSAPLTQNKELAERYSKSVYIELSRVPPKAEIGSLSDVKIITQQRDDVIKIPRGGLRSYMGRNYVRVLEEDSKLRELDVEPGITSSTEVEILKGLEEGQIVILQ